MVLPFPCHTVPLLRRGYNYLAVLDAPQVRVVRIACQLGALYPQLRELSVPVTEPLRTQGFGGGLVDDFEPFILQVIEQSTYGQLHDNGLAAPGRRREDDVVVTIVDRPKTFGLNSIEQGEVEH